LAAEKIAMAGGGTIGAAMPVQLGAPGTAAQPVDEKTVSYMRKEFRATAESRNRPPLLAEAMVDTDVAIPDIIEKGKLLTMTTDEALQHGFADSRRYADGAAGAGGPRQRRDQVYDGELGGERGFVSDPSDRELAPHHHRHARDNPRAAPPGFSIPGGQL
jgi:hypothetical protein